ncbi:MAG: hypothetical protein QOK40_2463, partial [Miltoncostaeaceae bacterium]|nr:hypothetical protein [Miltoncostaeaceae bacterium]
MAAMLASPSLALARAAGRLSRRLGRGGGTSLPGKLLLSVRAGAVAELGAGLPRGSVLVSATNGKTTTARLIAACARAAGWRLVANQSGANLASGVATALLDDAALPLAERAELGLFEVDEAALPAVAAQLRPRALVLMNLFRDQLDRHGELEALSTRWADALAGLPPAVTTVVANADDPAVAALVEGRAGSITFGIDDPAVALPALPHAADAKRCRRCGAPLEHDLVLLGHLGHWRCPACGAARPRPDVRATRVELDGARAIALRVETPAGPIEARLGLPGLHNAYNATAAIAGALALGVPAELIGPALAGSANAFGRFERVRVGGQELAILLAKNPAGANEIVRTILLDGAPLHLLVALNDRTADGHDVSWIWDVDFELLLPRIADLTLSGDRAHDLGLRFRYAGLDSGRMRIVPDLERGLDAAL